MDYLAKVNQIEKEEKSKNISISVKSERSYLTSVQGERSERSERSPVCSDVVIEPAAPNARLIYWERVTGIVGPAQPEFLAMVGNGPTASFWVIALYEGQPIWINSTVLRSRQAFAQQVMPMVMDQIREPR
jgi:hypothetical protein